MTKPTGTRNQKPARIRTTSDGSRNELTDDQLRAVIGGIGINRIVVTD